MDYDNWLLSKTVVGINFGLIEDIVIRYSIETVVTGRFKKKGSAPDLII